MFGRYSKLVGALAGNAVGLVLVYAATRGYGDCTQVNGEQACTLLGFNQAQITGAVLACVNSAFVYFFPANKPA